MKYEKENNFSTDYYECADSYSAYFSNKISVGDFCGRCAKADGKQSGGEWNHEKGYLTDTCQTAQDKYKAYLDYFRIAYEI